MRYWVLALIVVGASYFVEWIPNNSTPPQAPSNTASPGEFPWQL